MDVKRSVSLLISLFFLISTPVVFGEETYKMSDLVFRDGLYYKKFTDVPFTGKITGKNQGTIRNGKKDGPWVSYYENGQLQSRGTFKDGKKEGPAVGYHDNGQLLIKGTYKDDKRDGPFVSYHFNGKLRSKGTYKNGEKVGDWIESERKYSEIFDPNNLGKESD